ncbi:hypothetical protein [Nitrosococcus halophilus]|uniref:hypothetical protein n=1 Tax=Nitrosococcus halophilus TaxID=133539 RepID=UPI00059B9067|nr:hypothetical protein [Nitrosococcus halophilus]
MAPLILPRNLKRAFNTLGGGPAWLAAIPRAGPSPPLTGVERAQFAVDGRQATDLPGLGRAELRATAGACSDNRLAPVAAGGHPRERASGRVEALKPAYRRVRKGFNRNRKRLTRIIGEPGKSLTRIWSARKWLSRN